jgi:ABC-2 type transport system ATP-binding protein
MNTNNAAIAVENLSKSYGNFLAVDDVTFTIERGEIFAILGPNGAGKSTMIRMILDIIKPDKGNIAVFGTALTESAKNRIGYLPEERGLYKNVSILHLLTYLGQLKGMSKRDAANRATLLMEQLDLGEHLKNKLTALSKGMAQKVQFIATILHQPDLIIIDEPFSGLDPVNTQILKDLLYDMSKEGRTVVMSTHQMPQIEEMANRMLMISKGKRVLYGPVNDIREQYAENAVIVEGEGNWEALPGVTHISNGKANGAVTLHLNPDTSPDTIMQAIAVGQFQVKRFELAIPGLEEIFIRVVGAETTGEEGLIR